MNAGVEKQLFFGGSFVAWGKSLWDFLAWVLFLFLFSEGSGTMLTFFVLCHAIAFQSSTVSLLKYF